VPEGRAHRATAECLKTACRASASEASDGAEGGIRTPTGLLQLAPEASASAVPPLPHSEVRLRLTSHVGLCVCLKCHAKNGRNRGSDLTTHATKMAKPSIWQKREVDNRTEATRYGECCTTRSPNTIRRSSGGREGAQRCLQCSSAAQFRMTVIGEITASETGLLIRKRCPSAATV
jgi:hypothetical protein